MNMLFLVLLLTFFWTPMSMGSVDKVALKKSLQHKVENSGLGPKGLGIYVATAESPSELVFEMAGQQQLIPASATKIVTAAATLKEFPPGTKFKTALLSNAKTEGSVLKGDLVLKGSGDPGFVSESMWFLVNAFVRTGIKTIEGNIVVDDSLFDQNRFDSSRQKERVDRAYDAPTGAMSFNWNSVNVFVRPASKVGEAAQVFVDPENDYIRLKGQIKTVAKSGKTNVIVEREDDKFGDYIVIGGTIELGSKEIVVYKNISRPDLWSGANLKSFLAQRGIKLNGKVVAGKTPPGAQVLAEFESKPIESMITDMNKFSNNYVAEMLTKLIAAQKKGLGSISGGMESLNQYMQSLKVPADQYEIFNPSGLTRENKMSPFALWSVLADMKNHFEYQPEFAVSLPIAGIDGTLKNRMKGSDGQRHVRAKTGYLTNIISLAGYAGRKDGTVLPFVFIYNGSADEWKVRSFFDELATQLVD